MTLRGIGAALTSAALLGPLACGAAAQTQIPEPSAASFFRRTSSASEGVSA